MKKLSAIVISSTLAVAAFVTFGASPVSAQSSVQAGAEAARGNGVPAQLFGDGGIITNITNVLLFLAGALAVIMIIVGGIRYATSGGNSASVTAAKNTVMYAIVGLIIAFLAFAAVNWILGVVAGGTGSGYTNV